MCKSVVSGCCSREWIGFVLKTLQCEDYWRSGHWPVNIITGYLLLKCHFLQSCCYPCLGLQMKYSSSIIRSKKLNTFTSKSCYSKRSGSAVYHHDLGCICKDCCVQFVYSVQLFWCLPSVLWHCCSDLRRRSVRRWPNKSREFYSLPHHGLFVMFMTVNASQH